MDSTERAPNLVALRQKGKESLRFSADDKVQVIGTIPVEDLCLEVNSLKHNGFRNFWLLTYGARLLQMLFGPPKGRLAQSKE